MSLVLALGAVACGTKSAEPQERTYPRGGTLHVGLTGRGLPPDVKDFPYIDPQQDSERGLYRCCLLRTLLTFNGQPTDRGGTELRPDLATALPDVSADGLTWTFHLRRGVKYAPPLQNVEVKAQDFVRAVKRVFTPPSENFSGGPPFFNGIILGGDGFLEGKSTTIQGLEVPDDYTLVVRLLRPAGDLGMRFAQGAVAPIPPNPAHPEAPLGVADGVDDYGAVLAASGPYMIEGAEKIDYAQPPAKRKRPSGYDWPKGMTLVRNPSWTPAIDTIRKAYVDRIELTVFPDEARLAKQIDDGSIDLVLDASSPDDQVKTYQRDGTKQGRIYIYPNDDLFAIVMNVAVPPFDDLAVRRAVNFATDKSAVEKLPVPAFKQVATHVAVDSLEANLLSAYDPYRSADHKGDVAKAREEMKKSRYDANHDGLCDAAVCRNVRFIVRHPRQLCDETTDCSAGKKAPVAIADSLRRIGLNLVIEEPEDFYAAILDPDSKAPISYGAGWKKDFPNGASFFDDLFRSTGIGFSRLGFSSEELRERGYTVTEVPSVDAKLNECESRIGSDQVICWASLDQYIMEEVAPWVPLVSILTARVVSANIAHYGWDQAYAIPALDQVALKAPAAAK